MLIEYFIKVLFPIISLAHRYNSMNNLVESRDTYFFYAEQRSSTNESSGNHNPMAIIPKYDRKSEMPEDQKPRGQASVREGDGDTQKLFTNTNSFMETRDL